MRRAVLITLALACIAIAFFNFRQWMPASADNDTAMNNTPEPPKYQGRLRFLALGDSYTIGQSVKPSQRWPMQLAAKLRADGIDLSDPLIIARTGWTTADLLAAIDQAKLTGNFDLVTLLIGVNNQFQGRSEDEYRQQFAQLLQRATILAAGNVKRVVVLSIPDWSVTPFGQQYDTKRMTPEIDRFNDICRQETKNAGAGYVNVTPASRAATTQPDLIAEDGLHPSGRQYAAWTEAAAVEATMALSTNSPISNQ